MSRSLPLDRPTSQPRTVLGRVLSTGREILSRASPIRFPARDVVAGESPSARVVDPGEDRALGADATDGLGGHVALVDASHTRANDIIVDTDSNDFDTEDADGIEDIIDDWERRSLAPQHDSLPVANPDDSIDQHLATVVALVDCPPDPGPTTGSQAITTPVVPSTPITPDTFTTPATSPLHAPVMADIIDGMETTLMSRYMASVMGHQVATRAPTFTDDEDDIHACLETAFDLAQQDLSPLPHDVRDYSVLSKSCAVGMVAVDDVQCADHPETRFMMGKYHRGPPSWQSHTIVYFRRFLRFKNHKAWPSHAKDMVHLKWLATMFLYGFECAAAEGPTTLLPTMRRLLPRLNRIHAAWHSVHSMSAQSTPRHQRALPQVPAPVPTATRPTSPAPSFIEDEPLLEDSGSFTDICDILDGDLPASLRGSSQTASDHRVLSPQGSPAASQDHGSGSSAGSTTSSRLSTTREHSGTSTTTLKPALPVDPFDWDFLSGLTGQLHQPTLSKAVPTFMIPSASGGNPPMSAREAALQRQADRANERAHRAELALNERRLRDEQDAATRRRQLAFDQAALPLPTSYSTPLHKASPDLLAAPSPPSSATPATDQTTMDPFARFLEAQTRALENIANKREVSVQGMSLPQFHGKENESVEMFIWQARQFFAAKNFDLDDGPVQARCVTTIIANFRGNASFWYRSSESAHGKPTTIDELHARMEAYFTPTNLQNSLRDRLHTIHQSQFDNLFAYTAAFRGIIHQVTHMTERDQVGYYVRGLHASTMSMVKFTAPQTLDQAVQVATNYAAAKTPPTTQPPVANRRQESRPRAQFDRTVEFPRANRYLQSNRLPSEDGRGSSNQDARGSNYTTRSGYGNPSTSGSGGSRFGSNRYSGDARQYGPSDRSNASSGSSTAAAPRTPSRFDAVANEHHLCYNCHSRNHRSIACKEPKRQSSDRPKYFQRSVTQNTLRFVDHRRQDDADHDDYDFFSMNVARQRSVTSSNLLTVNVQVNGRSCVALIDSGASHDMIDHSLVNTNHRIRQRRANVAPTSRDSTAPTSWPPRCPTTPSPSSGRARRSGTRISYSRPGT